MELFKFFFDILLHLDKHLELIVWQYQTTTYIILCLIIFCETGLVATPFLPGDSLLFAAGAITAKIGVLNIWLLIPLLFCSAILGDNVNYFAGKFIGHKIFNIPILRKLVKRKYLDRAHEFYEKHGGKTIIIARFVPIVRTFAPFVAGIGEMKYSRYIAFCATGGILWVSLLTLAGFYFGNFGFVKNNFELVIFAIIIISLMPPVIEYFSYKLKVKNK